MFCPRCGDESPDGVRYCSACGAELRRLTDSGPGLGASLKNRVAHRLRRLAGRTRRERIVSGLTAGFVLVAVIGFVALDPAEDEATVEARESLDTQCVAAKARVVEAANALTGPGGPEEYAFLVVVAMTDLRDSGSASGLSGVEQLRAAALAAAAAAGRVGRLSRETPGGTPLREAVQRSVDALDALSAPTEALGLRRCASTSIDRDQ